MTKTLEKNIAIQKAKRMIAAKMRGSEIAKKCGLFQQEVTKIKNGTLDVDEGFQRCPECGGLVQMPCLLCELRKGKS